MTLIFRLLPVLNNYIPLISKLALSFLLYLFLQNAFFYFLIVNKYLLYYNLYVTPTLVKYIFPLLLLLK